MQENGRRSKVVVVTGASAGVGRSVVREFAKQHAKIGLVSRCREALEDVKREVEAAGGQAVVLPTDVSSPEAVEAAAQAVEDIFGPIDIWVNNAMVSVFSPVKEMQPEEYQRVTNVTYLGYVYGTLAALKRMLPRDRGVIVQVGSALAYRSIPLQSAYCASKHAINGFTESLRTELIHDKSQVNVTMVNLPAINTPQFRWVKSRLPNKPQPVPPIYQPEVAAKSIIWASEHCPRELNVAWPTIKAILGEKVMPGLLDHYLAAQGYGAQQTDEPEDPDRTNNLWHTVPGEYSAHGDFDDRSRTKSPMLWARTHWKWLAMGTLGIAATVAVGLTRQPEQRNGLGPISRLGAGLAGAMR